jgi:hypothetical protein
MSEQWRRASWCDNSGPSCAEVARDGDDFLLRNSERPDVVVRFTPAEWVVFMAGAKDGEFDS